MKQYTSTSSARTRGSFGNQRITPFLSLSVQAPSPGQNPAIRIEFTLPRGQWRRSSSPRRWILPPGPRRIRKGMHMARKTQFAACQRVPSRILKAIYQVHTGLFLLSLGARPVPMMLGTSPILQGTKPRAETPARVRRGRRNSPRSSVSIHAPPPAEGYSPLGFQCDRRKMDTCGDASRPNGAPIVNKRRTSWTRPHAFCKRSAIITEDLADPLS